MTYTKIFSVWMELASFTIYAYNVSPIDGMDTIRSFAKGITYMIPINLALETPPRMSVIEGKTALNSVYTLKIGLERQRYISKLLNYERMERYQELNVYGINQIYLNPLLLSCLKYKPCQTQRSEWQANEYLRQLSLTFSSII